MPSPLRHFPGSILFCAIFVLTGLARHSGAATQQPPTASQNPVVQQIEQAVYRRAAAVSSYTVQEQYNLYRNGDATPAAQETIQTTYSRETGKEYKPIAQTGSSLLRSLVIDKLLANEREVNLPANREGTWITSHNYDMQPQPGKVRVNGQDCIVVTLKPLHKSPHLFDGKIWVDATDFTLVRFEGTPSQPPSFFAGDTTVSRDYIRVQGFSMAAHAEAHSHSALFGDTVLKIDYTGYTLQLLPSTTSDKK